MQTKLPLILILCILFNSCSQTGERCAYVNIYNPKTGVETDIDVKVSVIDGRVEKIYFPNGGWLDESHFKNEDTMLDNEGYTSFIDDRGREISVIIQEEKDCEK